MSTRKRLQALALGVAAVIAAALNVSTAGAARADGKSEPRRLVNALPPVGLASGQTLRVNFLNAGTDAFEVVPCVLDADGAHIKTGPHVRLLPGQTRTFDLSRAEAGRAREPLVEVRAGVHVDESDFKSLVVSGEVFEDTTGKSSLFVPGTRAGFDPQPDPPAAR